MSIEFKKVDLSPNKFKVIILQDQKRAGEALFYEIENEPNVFGERVDIKEKFQNQGLATKALIEGDKIVRDKFPTFKRRFVDINKFSYNAYTDSISNDQIIDFDEKGLLFNP